LYRPGREPAPAPRIRVPFPPGPAEKRRENVMREPLGIARFLFCLLTPALGAFTVVRKKGVRVLRNPVWLRPWTYDFRGGRLGFRVGKKLTPPPLPPHVL